MHIGALKRDTALRATAGSRTTARTWNAKRDSCSKEKKERDEMKPARPGRPGAYLSHPAGIGYALTSG